MPEPDYPSSEDMLHEFRTSSATPAAPPEVDLPEASGVPAPAADPPPAPPPSSSGGDPFGGKPAREPYDPETAPATGDDRHAEWKSRGRSGAPTQEEAKSLFSRLRPVLLLVVIGAFVFNNFSSVFDGRTAVEELTIGDCFDDPGLDADFVEKVETVDCTQPHDFELFALPRYSGDGEYPGEVALFDWADEQCWASFESYVGVPFDQSELYFANMIPTEESWEQGDRHANCMLMRLGSDFEIVPSTGSYRNSQT